MAAFPIPRIRYNDGSGSVDLVPTYPPTKKPYMDDLKAVRHDSFSSSGIRQSMLERVDTIKHVEMENIPWADLPTLWQPFMTFAIEGGQFEFFPDSTATAFATYELVEDQITPTFSSRGLSKISFTIRLVPGGASHA